MTRSAAEIIDDHIEKLESAMRLSAAATSSMVVASSPVDTGSFRASWNGAINAIDRSVVTIDSGTPFARRSSVTAVLNALRPGNSYFFTNSKIYGPRLEYGYSAQAPAGFVRVALMQWQRTVDQSVRQVR